MTIESRTRFGFRAGCFLVLLIVCPAPQLVTVPKANASVVSGVGWDGAGLNAVTLTYSLVQGTPDLSNELKIIQSALDEWNNYVQITFKLENYANAPRELDFYFTGVDPRTGSPWVGAIGAQTLAVGYLPEASEPFAGNVYFNDNYNWTGNMLADGTCLGANCDLYFVALHEIGHTLGLAHSPNDTTNLAAGAVMSPFFNPVGNPDPANPGFGNFAVLQADDIAGIRSLYASGQGAMIVPGPSTLMLVGVGLLALGRMSRKG